MDVCCLNRPFDDQTQDRIRIESDAILAILSKCVTGEWKLLSRSEGRLQLIVGLCEKMGVKDIFNKHLQKKTGRPSDIPPGIEAEVMIAGICIDEGYRPLYAMQDYYEYKDLTGIFHHPIKLSQLNDDRFGDFLDDFYNVGSRRVFMEISARASAE